MGIIKSKTNLLEMLLFGEIPWECLLSCVPGGVCTTDKQPDGDLNQQADNQMERKLGLAATVDDWCITRLPQPVYFPVNHGGSCLCMCRASSRDGIHPDVSLWTRMSNIHGQAFEGRGYVHTHAHTHFVVKLPRRHHVFPEQTQCLSVI